MKKITLKIPKRNCGRYRIQFKLLKHLLSIQLGHSSTGKLPEVQSIWYPERGNPSHRRGREKLTEIIPKTEDTASARKGKTDNMNSKMKRRVQSKSA